MQFMPIFVNLTALAIDIFENLLLLPCEAVEKIWRKIKSLQSEKRRGGSLASFRESTIIAKEDMICFLAN